MRSDKTILGVRTRHEAPTDHLGESTRQRMITVIVLEDRFSGALAYALQSALHEPAKIRVVRVGQPRERHLDQRIPLPIRAITAQAADALARQSAGHDVIVVETPGHVEATADSLLDRLRRHASCLLVEVDDDGQLIRASGPEGWTYPALGDAATTTAIDPGPS